MGFVPVAPIHVELHPEDPYRHPAVRNHFERYPVLNIMARPRVVMRPCYWTDDDMGGVVVYYDNVRPTSSPPPATPTHPGSNALSDEKDEVFATNLESILRIELWRAWEYRKDEAACEDIHYWEKREEHRWRCFGQCGEGIYH